MVHVHPGQAGQTQLLPHPRTRLPEGGDEWFCAKLKPSPTVSSVRQVSRCIADTLGGSWVKWYGKLTIQTNQTKSCLNEIG